MRFNATYIHNPWFKVFFIIIICFWLFYKPLKKYFNYKKRHEKARDILLNPNYSHLDKISQQINDFHEPRKVIEIVEKRYNHELTKESTIISIINNLLRAYSIIIPLLGIQNISKGTFSPEIFYIVFDIVLLLFGFVITLAAQIRKTFNNMPSSQTIIDSILNRALNDDRHNIVLDEQTIWLYTMIESENTLKANNDARMEQIKLSTKCLVLGTILAIVIMFF